MQAVNAKSNYPRNFCQFEFTHDCDFADLQPDNFVSAIKDLGFFPSECLGFILFAWLTATLPSFKKSTIKNMI